MRDLPNIHNVIRLQGKEVLLDEKGLSLADFADMSDAGIVAGGGVALLRAIDKLKDLKAGDADEKVGINIIKKALEEPVRQIAKNAGFESSVVVEKVRKSASGISLDAEKGEYVDMIKAGIVDPVKVTRTALENAASISSTILTTEALITDMPEEKRDMPPMPGGMGGGGMGGGGMGGMY